MIELIEFIVAGTAMGAATAYIGKKAFFDSTEKQTKETLHNRSLGWEARTRLNALKELLQINAEIGSSTSDMHVNFTHSKDGVCYHFHFKNRPHAFLQIAFLHEKNRAEIARLSSLDKYHKEVHDTVEQLKKKIEAKHRQSEKNEQPALPTQSVQEKYEELHLQIKNLYLSNELEEAERNELRHTIEPMLHDVMNHYLAYNGEKQAAFTSKTLDIFYYLEKKMNIYQSSCAQKQQDALHTYFSTMEQRAKRLLED